MHASLPAPDAGKHKDSSSVSPVGRLFVELCAKCTLSQDLQLGPANGQAMGTSRAGWSGNH